MKDPCKWCDGRTAWNGSKWIQKDKCEEKDSCNYYYEEHAEPKDKKQWKVTFPKGCTVQIIVRTKESGKNDRVFQLFEDSEVALQEKVIRWITESIWQILIEKSEDNLPF